MTSLLDTLERRGLVERHPHPSDRRKILVHLTDEARRIVDETLPVQHAVIRAAVEDVSEVDREKLITTLATIWPGLSTWPSDRSRFQKHAGSAGDRPRPDRPDPRNSHRRHARHQI